MNFGKPKISRKLSKSMDDLDSILSRLKIAEPSYEIEHGSHFIKVIENGQWHMYQAEGKGLEPGRVFYYNPQTKVKRWKPPRQQQQQQQHHQHTAGPKAKIPRTLQSLPSFGTLVPAYDGQKAATGNVEDISQVKDHKYNPNASLSNHLIFYAKKIDLETGVTFFIDLIKGVKWLQQGNYYFCEEDGKCLWELPRISGLLITSLAQVMYAQDSRGGGQASEETTWCRRLITLESKNAKESNLHILRTNFRYESAVCREITLDILETQWTRTSSHSLHLATSSSSNSKVSLEIKFDHREDLVRWLSQLDLLKNRSGIHLIGSQSVHLHHIGLVHLLKCTLDSPFLPDL